MVKTTYPMPHSLMAAATFSGSFGSGGGGVFDVFTAQNLPNPKENQKETKRKEPNREANRQMFVFLVKSVQRNK